MKKRFFLSILYLLSIICVYADLESIMPGGVAYKLEYNELNAGYFYFKYYGSQTINCKRKNETYNADVGFNVSDHSETRYNYTIAYHSYQWKSINNSIWSDGTNYDVTSDGTQFSGTLKINKSYLDNLKGNENSILLRFRFYNIKYSCENYQENQGGHTYWMHNYSFIGSNVIGSPVLDESYYEYVYLLYDGTFKELPYIKIYNVTSDYYNENENFIKTAYVKVRVYNVSASIINDDENDLLNLSMERVRTDENVTSPTWSTVYAIKDLRDVVGGSEIYCETIQPCEYDFSNNNTTADFLFGATLNFYGVDITSNNVFQKLGNNWKSGVKFWIYWKVSESGTINAFVVKNIFGLNNSIIQGYYRDDNIKWRIMNSEFISSTLAYNPYKSESDRNVSRLINLTATFEYENETYRLESIVEMPKLGESNNNENGNIEDKPLEEDRPIDEEEEFQNNGTVNQSNELLNQMLEELRNGRDENLEYYKYMKDFMDVDDLKSEKVKIVDGISSNTDIDDIQGGLVDGDGVFDYGDVDGDLTSGFGNGVGDNINQFKNLGTHDLTFTLDLTGCSNMFPDMDTSAWIWHFSLYPDVSTSFGQGIDNIITVYVRPIFLFFLWFYLGVLVVKDVSAFFGNNASE